jgi:hypothetical protein
MFNWQIFFIVQLKRILLKLFRKCFVSLFLTLLLRIFLCLSSSLISWCFKFNKSDIIVKISDIEKISVNSIQLCQLKNVLYLSVSSRAAVNVNEKQISVLLNLKVKVNLVEKRFLKAQHILFYWLLTQTNKHQQWKNNSVQHCWECICLNNLICVIQSLLIIKKASQSMILNMSYVSATFMIIRAYSNSKINVEITSSQDDRWIWFQNFK